MLGCVTGPSETKLGLVLEFCSGGNLLNHLRKIKEMEEEEKLEKLCGRQFGRWAWQIADGMRFLASKNLVHRDLAARNVLLDGEMVAKVEIKF
jgi:serine/threonine protein kinase